LPPIYERAVATRQGSWRSQACQAKRRPAPPPKALSHNPIAPDEPTKISDPRWRSRPSDRPGRSSVLWRPEVESNDQPAPFRSPS
jgi:hypothetical protein